MSADFSVSRLGNILGKIFCIGQNFLTFVCYWANISAKLNYFRLNFYLLAIFFSFVYCWAKYLKEFIRYLAQAVWSHWDGCLKIGFILLRLPSSLQVQRAFRAVVVVLGFAGSSLRGAGFDSCSLQTFIRRTCLLSLRFSRERAPFTVHCNWMLCPTQQLPADSVSACSEGVSWQLLKGQCS